MGTKSVRDGKLPIDQAQCDHQAGWRNFSLKTFEPVNITILRPCMKLTRLIGHIGIAAANTSHIQYFDCVDRRDKYDKFFSKFVIMLFFAYFSLV
jgi:hypothetical protein